MQTFDDKVVIVTGGGSGLGEAIGKSMARQGALVVLTDIDLQSAQRVVRDIESEGGTASAVEQDTANPQDSERVVQYTVDTHGALHYAVNNAGVWGAQAPVGETDLEE